MENNSFTSIKKICVIGLGYIGLPTASLLATKGYHVFGVDIDSNIVDTINNGGIHIVEPDLDVLVRSAVNSGNLKASQLPVPADVFIIAVPTPFKDNHIPDLSYVESATESILPYIRHGNLVILESTSPVGTTQNIVGEHIKKRGFRIEEDIYIAYCPERVLPGQILHELVNNDRIIGGMGRKSAEKAEEFYRTFSSGEIFLTDARTAELTKLTENAFRDVNIAFANELSIICEELNIDVWELIRLANRHPRVNILQPGPGVGGHCIAVDPWFIIASVPDNAKLVKASREVNNYKAEWVLKKIINSAQKLNSPIIGCLGLTYKPNIDDVRESPSFKIVQALRERGYKVICSDPNLNNEKIKDLTVLDTKKVIDEADVLVLLVAHKEYRNIDFGNLKDKVIIKIVNL